jgi:dihydroceramide fatty acyl 2-hydroxylase
VPSPFTDELLAAAEEVPWRPLPGSEGRRTLPLFRAPLLQGLFFDGHPALPYLLGVPLIGVVLEHAGAPQPSWAAWLLLGVAAWTLLEYGMHRFLFHPPTGHPVGRVLGFLVHGHHHRTPLETTRLAATPLQMASALGLLFAVFGALLPPEVARPTFVGSVVGYLAYEGLHHMAHHGRPRWGPLRAVQRHHLRHHYDALEGNWGISSPVWDVVFRSRR